MPSNRGAIFFFKLFVVLALLCLIQVHAQDEGQADQKKIRKGGRGGMGTDGGRGRGTMRSPDGGRGGGMKDRPVDGGRGRSGRPTEGGRGNQAGPIQGGNQRPPINDGLPQKAPPSQNQQEQGQGRPLAPRAAPAPKKKTAADGPALLAVKNAANSKSGRVSKAVNSNKSRLLFVVGMEGAQDHAMNSVLQVCIDDGFCQVNRNITDGMYRLTNSRGMMQTSSSLDAYDHMLEDVYNSMLTVAADKSSKLHILSLQLSTSTKRVDSRGPIRIIRSMDFPDLFPISVLAEKAGLDFRILVLVRSSADILTQLIPGARYEVKTIIDTTAKLFTQLSMIDNKFFQCVHNKKLESFQDKSVQLKLKGFLHPSMTDKLMENMWNAINADESKAKAATTATTAATPVAATVDMFDSYNTARLDATLRMVENVCNGK